MILRKVPNYILVGTFLFIVSMVLLYSNIIIYSLNFYKPRPAYWDLTNGINPLWNCFKSSGLKLFSLDSVTFPSLESCRNFNYGYFSVASFGLFHIISRNQNFWGVLQVFTFCILIGRTFFDGENKKGSILIFILALGSPGIFLLEASGNMDIQIVSLILLALLFFRRGNVKFAVLLISLSALFKFYSSPLLLIFTLILKKKNDRIFGFTLMLITGFIIIFQMLWTPIPPFPGGAQNKFGAMIIGNYMRKAGFSVSNFQGEILGIFIVLLFVLILFIFRFKSSSYIKSTPDLTSDLEEIRYRHLYFFVMALTSIVCYFSALSVDYRLVFVSLAGLSLLQLNQEKVRIATKFFPYVFFVSLWFVFPFAYLSKYFGKDLQPIGDIALMATIAYFIFQSIFSLKFLIKENFLQIQIPTWVPLKSRKSIF